MLHTTKSYNISRRSRRIIVRDRLHTAAHSYKQPHTATHSYKQLNTATHSHTQMGYRQPHCRIIN